MKFRRLLFLVPLMLSISCSSTSEVTSQRIEDKEEVEKDVAEILGETSKKANGNAYGLTFSCSKGQSIKLDALFNEENYVIDALISPFSFDFGINNLNGTKQERKIGLKTSGISLTAKTTMPESFFLNSYDYRISTNEASAYFIDGSLYMDLSKSNIKDVIYKMADTYLGSGTELGIYKALINKYLGDIRYQYAFPDLKFPFIYIQDALKLDYVRQVGDWFINIEEAALDWNDFISLYSYSDGSYKVDFSFTKELMDKAFNKNQERTFKYNALTAAVSIYVNSDKIINKVEVKDDIDIEISEDTQVVHLIASGDYQMDFSYGSNNIIYPSKSELKDYQDFENVKSLIDLFVSVMR